MIFSVIIHLIGGLNELVIQEVEKFQWRKL